VKVGFISLGCAKNRVDTEIMMAVLKKEGHHLVFDVDKAEAVFINTCSFIETAQQEAVDKIIKIGARKKIGALKYLFATGCLPQRFGEQLLDELPELDGIIGIGYLNYVAKALVDCAEAQRICKISPAPIEFIEYGERILTTPPGMAYLKITEGCGNECSYCTIPIIRGRLRSRPLEGLLKEAQSLAEAGIKELVLIGQDTAAYGIDLTGKKCLPRLLDELSGINDLHWIRLMYVHPAHLEPDIIKRLAENDKVIPYLDLPVQHISDSVLAKMNRRHDRRHLLDLLSLLSSEVPGLCLRTTVMVGFPGETEEDFKELCDFVAQAHFDWLGAFAFQSEAGARAADMDGHVDEVKKAERLHKIMQIQKKITRKKNINRIDSIQKILISSLQEKNLYLGRGYFQAPEVDGLTLVKSEKPLKKGAIVEVTIKAVRDYDLIGEYANESAQ